MSSIDWLAGLIDGEGHFGILITLRGDRRKIRFRPRFMLVMAINDNLENAVEKIFTQHEIKFFKGYRKATDKRREQVSYTVIGLGFHKLTALIKNKLIVKTEQVKLLNETFGNGFRCDSRDPSKVKKICKAVDGIHALNIGRCKIKWTGDTIMEHHKKAYPTIYKE